MRTATILALALSVGACATSLPPRAMSLSGGEVYVAMGSSFAAGPGVSTSADTPPNRCARSSDNYAHLLAKRRGLALTDVSCSGATTRAVLDGWGDLPAQIAAIGPETRLVTVTIGGNDIGYIGSLGAAACAQRVAQGVAERCAGPPPPSETAFADLEERLRAIAEGARARAPQARVIFVDYLAVLSPGEPCAATPISSASAEQARRLADRLAVITARAARDGGAEVLAASKLSRGHDACAKEPWTNGAPQPGAAFKGASFHPNLAGMEAIARALDRRLGARR